MFLLVRNLMLFSKAAVPFYIPASNVQELPFLRILSGVLGHHLCIVAIVISHGISLWFQFAFHQRGARDGE